MSDGGDKLTQSRRAIVEYIQRRDRRPEKNGEAGTAADDAESSNEGGAAARERGWFGSMKQAAAVWWRHHPAHMALEVATPLLAGYTREKPVQVLGIAAAAGVALVLLRPWRLISLTTVLLAVVKSSQLSSVVISAMSAADGWQSQATEKS